MTHQKQTMRQKRLAINKMIVSTSFRVFLMLFIVALSVLYVLQTSSVSTKGYDINELQNKIVKLQRDNQKVEFEIAQYRSMSSIQERLARLDLVVADDVKYLTLVGNTVARR